MLGILAWCSVYHILCYERKIVYRIGHKKKGVGCKKEIMQPFPVPGFEMASNKNKNKNKSKREGGRRESACVREREIVCVCVREREIVCVCVRERERVYVRER
jgi:hypothetical protein